MKWVKQKKEKGIPVLSVNFTFEDLQEIHGSNLLADELIEAYDSRGFENNSPCIVEFNPEIGSAAIVRAFYLLTVHTGRKVYLVGYPEDYVQTIINSGLFSIGSLKIVENKEEAFEDIRRILLKIIELFNK